MITTLATLARILRLIRPEEPSSIRTAVESTSEAALVLDPEGRVAALSASAAESGLQLGDEVVARAAGEGEFRRLRVGFTAAVSHELRTPLARLLALVDGADLPGADPRALLEAARAEVMQMTELVNDVLFLSEVETGREVVSLQGTAARPVLQEVADSAGERVERAGVAFEVVAAEDVEVPIRPRLLRTVVENLVENVLRHGHGATRCTLSARREGGRVLLAVADNGAGVPAEDLPRIFERFYRGDASRASTGSGLGLSIVKHVMAAAGAEVEARRGPGGVGLEIRCTFPAPR
jgi:two-component system, OmpR family, phosphate regulon sensor histidine kinase PhoR